ncbi:hypothetical protein MNBD_GAMMA23-944 [hydrothermal vent metagenome]|uniref:FimV N-terminal domain-containing protein n=1 Tax=hydrothermal vent metagenome TaxID=652676 RepID=A0A3B1A7F5_9ZZZZ
MGISRLYARKLAILVAVIGITVTPSFVYSLGLGAIKLNSSLSEILDAEIDLVAATSNDVSDLKVKLASRDAFLRAGIDRAGLLSSLRFSVKRNNSGKYFIKITSRKPIREPFLNFLLEVNWKNGRMLREYTVLIDPPGRRIQQPQQSTIQAPQTTEVETANEPVAVAAPEPSPFKDDVAPAVVEESQPVVIGEPEKAEAAPEVDDTYINDKELLPHRPIDDVAALAEPESVTEKMPEPVVEAAPEPVIPETTPEPVILETTPEPVIEPEPETLVLDDSALSGDVRAEHQQSGQVIDDKHGSEMDMPAHDDASTETFAEGELFPTIPLTEYDESKSIDYDEEPAGEVEHADHHATEMGTEIGSGMAEPHSLESGDLDYGITKKSDNLWSIASRMKGDDVTVYQVMMALLKSNPNAFTDSNIHRLKVGQVLRIDDPSLITAISKEQAAQDYMEQTDAWDAYRQQVAAAAEQQPLSTGQFESDTSDNIAAAPSGELTLSAPEGEDLSAATTPSQDSPSQEVASLREELQRITQQADAERGKNSALNDRLRELEAEIESMQRSLTVRNDEFAALQQQIGKSAEEPAPVAAEVAPEPVPQEESSSAPQLEDEPAAAIEAETPTAPVVEVPAEMESATADETMDAPPPAPEVAEAPVLDLDEPAPAEDMPSQASTSLVDTIMATVTGILKPVLASSLLLFIGVPVLIIVVLILVVMMFRKRSSAKNNFEESILSGAAPIDDEPAVSVASSQNSSETSSFLSDFAISGVGAIQTEDSEVDPLTEADVFMAYGRYEAAEERLQEAIVADPERVELKVKLLEVYNTNKNQTAFEATAEELYASMGDTATSDSNWQKVVVMGKQIAPNNPIFSASPTITSETTESVLGAMEENLSNVSMTDSQVMDIGLETGVFSAEDLSPESSSETESDISGLDFNLGDDAPVTDQEDTKDNIEAPDTEGLDFNLDMGADDDESTKSMAIDLNEMGLGDLDTTDDDPTASMAFDADALDLDSTSAQLDTGALDFSMDTDESDSSLDLNLDAGDAMDMSLSADADEVGTKLDLAKAYIDMGDSAGAKSILDEVLEEGNDEQKSEAEQLVSQLG